MKSVLAAVAVVMMAGIANASDRRYSYDDVRVEGYTRRNGTQVEGHYRSRANAYNWDNYNYEPSQPKYNKSYYDDNRSSEWREPNRGRMSDKNPFNDMYQ